MNRCDDCWWTYPSRRQNQAHTSTDVILTVARTWHSLQQPLHSSTLFRRVVHWELTACLTPHHWYRRAAPLGQGRCCCCRRLRICLRTSLGCARQPLEQWNWSCVGGTCFIRDCSPASASNMYCEHLPFLKLLFCITITATVPIYLTVVFYDAPELLLLSWNKVRKLGIGKMQPKPLFFCCKTATDSGCVF